MTRFYAASNFILSFIALIAIVFFTACSKQGANPSSQNSLTISSINVDSGGYNTEVLINGTGFSTAAANDHVFYNGVAATVEEVSNSRLLTFVPLAAGSGYITITVNGVTVKGPAFTYQPQEVVTVIAGSNGNSGAANGIGTAAAFFLPTGITADENGNLYVSDTDNNLIRKISPAGVVSTLAGGGANHATNGTGTMASFNGPAGIATDANGNVYVADVVNNLIRKITPTGVVSTLAGGGTPNIEGSYIEADGTGGAASFNKPVAVAVDGSGNVFVSDQGSGRIRKITPAGVVTTIPTSTFFTCYGIAVDNSGNIYTTDTQYNNIFKTTQSGVTINFAGGNPLGGSFDGTGNKASFSQPRSMTMDKNGNLYVCDLGSGEIRKVTPGAVVTTIAGQLPTDILVGVANNVLISDPAAITVDNNGNIFLVSSNQIQEISVQ